jgi:DNA-binding transcriptional LysR family regulator
VAAKNLQALHFNKARLVFVVPKEHELTQRKHIKQRNILAFHYVGMQEGSTLQASVRDQTELLSENLVWRIRLSRFEAVCRMLEVGFGIGVIPESAAICFSKILNLAILLLDEPWGVRERSILIRDIEALPGWVKVLIILLQNHC